MNIKNVFLVLVLVVRVRSDCDGYFECLSGFVKDYLSGNKTVSNNTGEIDFGDFGNKSVGLLDLSHVGRSLSQALTDVTTLIKDEIKGMFKIDDETDVHKEIDNKTEIHVKALSLSKSNGNVTEKASKTENIGPLSEVIVNNLTKFNDKLNALKIEIERNLQAELENFISQILENDTVDWVDVTENSFESELTTLKPYPDFEEAFEITTETTGNASEKDAVTNEPKIDHNKIHLATTESAIAVNTESTIVPIENKLVLENETIVLKDQTLEAATTTSDRNTTATISSSSVTLNTVAPVTTSSVKSTTVKPTTIASSTKMYAISTTTVAAQTTEKQTTAPTTKITTTAPTTISSTRKETVSTTTISTQTTKQQTTKSSTKITKAAPTKASSTNKDKVFTKTTASQTAIQKTTKPPTEVTTEKQKTHTKSPIDYKLLENFKVNEISNEDLSYYEIKDDNSTDYPIIDYVDLYKDTTNEDLDYVPTPKTDNEIKSDLENLIQNGDELNYENNGDYSNDTSNPASVFPWLVAIFIKNGTNNQFDYYCDGTLLSDKAVLTAARCLQRGNETVNADDVITFLGKRSLQNTAQGEVILRVQQLTIHPNFSLQNQAADLAVLQLEEPVVFTDLIQPACLVDDGETDEAVATAWGETLSLIKFAEKNHTCVGEPVDNTFCATYGASVALCPSYGGVYAALESGRWCAAGVRTGDVTKRGLCFDKTVAFTDLRAYTQWLRDFSQ